MDASQSRHEFQLPALAIQAAGPGLLQNHDYSNDPFQLWLLNLRQTAADCRISCSEDLESFRTLARSLSQNLTEERGCVEKELRDLIDDKILKFLSTTLEIGDTIFTRLAIINEALQNEDIQRNLLYNSHDVLLAWTCLLWSWAAWNQDCRRIIAELSPVLNSFKNWTPPCDKAWKWGLYVLAHACDKRLRERHGSQPESWD